MAGKSYIAETRELAFRTWREQGQNVERTIKAMKQDHGIPVTKPTLYDWMEKFNWKERATRADVAEQSASDAVVSDEAKIMADLEKQRQKYERYFDSLGDAAIDPQATYAYNSLAKTISDIRTKTGAMKTTFFLDFWKDLIDWLSRNDPGAVPVIEQNFDNFMSYAREKYGT